MNWQPIETAPLRVAVIVYHKSYWSRLACLHEDGSWTKWPGSDFGDDNRLLPYQPTHWADIPEDP